MLDPENYGPYLDEGESYALPRTQENITKAAKQMGLYDQDNEGEKEFYEHLIYENWIMFDGRMRSIKGV